MSNTNNHNNRNKLATAAAGTALGGLLAYYLYKQRNKIKPEQVQNNNDQKTISNNNIKKNSFDTTLAFLPPLLQCYLSIESLNSLNRVSKLYHIKFGHEANFLKAFKAEFPIASQLHSSLNSCIPQKNIFSYCKSLIPRLHTADRIVPEKKEFMKKVQDFGSQHLEPALTVLKQKTNPTSLQFEEAEALLDAMYYTCAEVAQFTDYFVKLLRSKKTEDEKKLPLSRLTTNISALIKILDTFHVNNYIDKRFKKAPSHQDGMEKLSALLFDLLQKYNILPDQEMKLLCTQAASWLGDCTNKTVYIPILTIGSTKFKLLACTLGLASVYKTTFPETGLQVLKESLQFHQTNREQSRVYNSMGVICGAQKNYERASEYYKTAHELDPIDFRTAMNYIYAVDELKLYSVALDFAENFAYRIRPQNRNGEIYREIGRLYSLLLNDQAALASYTTSCEYESDHWTGHCARLDLMLKLKQINEALDVISKHDYLYSRFDGLLDRMEKNLDKTEFLNILTQWANYKKLYKPMRRLVTLLKPTKPELALELCGECIKEFKQPIELSHFYNLSGIIQSTLLLYDKALENYAMSRQLNPNDFQITLNAVWILHTLKRYSEGLTLAEYMLEKFEKVATPVQKTDLFKQLGELNKYLHKHTKAIQYFTKVLEIDPEHWAVSCHLVESLVRLNEYEKAINAIKKSEKLSQYTDRVLERVEKYVSKQTYLAFIKKGSEMQVFRCTLRMIYLVKASNGFKPALKLGKEALKIYTNPIQLGLLTNEIGVLYHAQKRFALALKKYEEAKILHTKDFQINFNAVIALKELKQWDKGLILIQDIHSKFRFDMTQSQFTSYYRNLGELYMGLQQYEIALEHLNEACKRDRAHWMTEIYRLQLLLVLNKFEEALHIIQEYRFLTIRTNSILEKLAEQNPHYDIAVYHNFLEFGLNQQHLKCAVTLITAKDTVEAIRLCNSCIEIFTNNDQKACFHQLLAKLYAEDKKQELALTHSKVAKQLNCKDFQTQFEYVTFLLSLKQYQQALDEAKLILITLDNSLSAEDRARMMRTMALLYDNLYNYLPAIHYIKKAIHFNPTDSLSQLDLAGYYLKTHQPHKALILANLVKSKALDNTRVLTRLNMIYFALKMIDECIHILGSDESFTNHMRIFHCLIAKRLLNQPHDMKEIENYLIAAESKITIEIQRIEYKHAQAKLCECHNKMDEALELYNTVIESKLAESQVLAAAYKSRGKIYESRKQYQLAEKDWMNCMMTREEGIGIPLYHLAKMYVSEDFKQYIQNETKQAYEHYVSSAHGNISQARKFLTHKVNPLSPSWTEFELVENTINQLYELQSSKIESQLKQPEDQKPMDLMEDKLETTSSATNE